MKKNKKSKNNDEIKHWDDVLRGIILDGIPKNFILKGILRTSDGEHYEIDKNLLETLIKMKGGFDDEEIDQDDLEQIFHILEKDPYPEFDVVIDIEKLKDEVTKEVEAIIQEYFRSKTRKK